MDSTYFNSPGELFIIQFAQQHYLILDNWNYIFKVLKILFKEKYLEILERYFRAAATHPFN